MTHNMNGRDVEAAVKRYQGFTGDLSAVLTRDGATYSLASRHLRGSWYGATAACEAIGRFCEGWMAGNQEGYKTGRRAEQVLPRG